MGIPNLFQHFGWWSIVVPVLGIVLAAVVRKRPWGVIVWLPTTLLCLYQTVWLGLKLLAYSGVSGPDAIGVGLAFMVLVPSVLAGVACLVACFLIRPRKKTWHWGMAVAAVALCISLSLLMNRQDGLTVTIQLLDEDSKPLQGITALSKAIEQGMTAGGSQSVSDADGKISMRLRKGQKGEIEFRAPFPASNSLSQMPARKTLRIEPDLAGHRLVLPQFWQRSVGTIFNEGLTEIVTLASEDHAEFTILLPKTASLGVPALEERVRTSLAAGVPAESACRNTESLACIPLLIESYRGKGPVVSPWGGLRQVARILDNLTSAAQKMRDISRRKGSYNLDYIEGQFAYEMTQLGIWVGAPTGATHTEIIAHADEKISTHVRLLIDFIVTEQKNNDAVAEILRDLQDAARPLVGEVVDALIQNPPKTGRSAQRWGHGLFPSSIQGRRIENVRRLFESEVPALVLVACDAMGNQLESEGGAYALERLRAVKPLMTDKDMIQRADMFISILTFKPTELPQ
jgi:hypothetical protein